MSEFTINDVIFDSGDISLKELTGRPSGLSELYPFVSKSIVIDIKDNVIYLFNNTDKE